MLRIITLVLALSLILTVAAHSDTPLARRHAPALNRMIKKRAGLPIINDAAAPQNAPQQPPANVPSPSSSSAISNTDTVSSADTQSFVNQPQPTTKTSATTSSVATTPTSVSAQSSSASPTAILPSILNPVLGGTQTANSTASSSSSTSSSSTSSSSSSTLLTSSSSSSAPSSTQSSTPTAAPQSQTGVNAVTITTAASAASASASTSSSASVTKLQRNTIIILVAIGASIGAAGIIWTIIRKWKFRPSSSFEDRMQPIDWQPTTEPHEERDMTERLTRNGSTRSHGSFTSGNNHDNLSVDLPPHDFTPGPAHLAPVGGYADLQRGPSPQPDLQRGPSFRTPGDYQYEMPNPHGQYYTGAGPGVGAGVGAYHGGYDPNRGY